jgi:hypothetical protein
MRTNSLGASVPNPSDLQTDVLHNLMEANLKLGDQDTHSAGHDKTAKVHAGGQAPASIPTSVNLTPDGLMAYCQSRMNSLDTQMNTIFNAQQGNSKVTQDVDTIAGILNDIPQVPNSSSSDTNPNMSVDAQTCQDINHGYSQAIADAKAGGNTALVQQLTKDQNTFNSEIGSTPQDPKAGTLSSNSLSNLQQNLKNYGNELNSDSEMSMINLQSLMSQRETAVQLTTNLVQSLGQQAQDVAKNVGQ